MIESAVMPPLLRLSLIDYRLDGSKAAFTVDAQFFVQIKTIGSISNSNRKSLVALLFVALNLLKANRVFQCRNNMYAFGNIYM